MHDAMLHNQRALHNAAVLLNVTIVLQKYTLSIDRTNEKLFSGAVPKKSFFFW